MANSVPTLTGLTTPVTFLENTVNGAPQIIAADVTFTDPDNNFDGGTLTVTGLLAQDTVAIRNQGSGAGQIGISGSNVTFGGILIGSFAGGAGSTLAVTFNASATAQGIEALIENLTYANSSDTPTASRSLELKVTDAAGFAALAPLAFVEQTGAANPVGSIDVGYRSAPTLADLDGDGDLDMVVGDTFGNLRYYKNTGTAIAPVFSLQNGAANPFNGVDIGSKSAPTFADLDGDGDLDAIIGADAGTLSYYKNTGTAIAPVFSLQSGAANPFDTVDLAGFSMPVFVDLDGDGDLDAAVGNNSSGLVKYFQNIGSATSPVFDFNTGNITGIDAGVDSHPSFADFDGDGDLDAIIGENFGTLKYFENTGTAVAANFVERTGSANPFNGVDIGYMTAPTLGDIDGDGDLDLISGDDDGILHYFLNTTPHQPAPDFVEQTGAANPFNGVDVGTYSAPVFADLDGDGDLDAVVGWPGGTLRYFKNTGTAIAPVFAEQTGGANPFNGVDAGTLSTPSFADLDGDGDLDAVVGAQDGTLHYFKNTGTATAPVFAEQTGAANPFNGVDIEFNSAPSFADLDGDGDLDAIVGTEGGPLRYFKNTGTGTAPVFAEQTGGANPFNGVDVGSYSTPAFADLDGDGDLDAIVGELNGTLRYFENTGSATTPAFTERTGAANPFNGADVGRFSTPGFADLDGDGDLDVIAGGNDGTLRYFTNTGAGFVQVVNVTAQNDAATLSADVRNLTEANTAAAISSSGTLTNTDPDGPATFVAQAGTAGLYGTFAITAGGAWTYTASSAHNEFQAGTTYTDTFSVASSDGTLTSVTINIAGSNDAATLSADVRNLTETNSAADISSSGTLTITDPDSLTTFVAQAGTVGLYGTFAIDSAGAWTYTASSAHDAFMAGATYTDTFEVASTDGTLTSVTINIAGTADATNSVPTLTGLATPVTFLENTANATPQIIDADVTFTDPDNNFDTGALTVTGLLAEDTVAIRNQGSGAGQIGVSGSDVTFGGTVIGSFAGGAGSTLTVTFNAAATAAAIEALIENLTYANSSDAPTASRSLELKVSDATGFAAIAPLAFAQQTGAANPFNGVDVGLVSAPSFADLDGDGDLDAVVGKTAAPCTISTWPTMARRTARRRPSA